MDRFAYHKNGMTLLFFTQHSKSIDTMAAGPHCIIAVSYKYLYIHGTYAAQTWAYTACGSAHHSTQLLIACPP